MTLNSCLSSRSLIKSNKSSEGVSLDLVGFKGLSKLSDLLMLEWRRILPKEDEYFEALPLPMLEGSMCGSGATFVGTVMEPLLDLCALNVATTEDPEGFLVRVLLGWTCDAEPLPTDPTLNGWSCLDAVRDLL